MEEKQLIDAMEDNWVLFMTYFVPFTPKMRKIEEIKNVVVVSSDYADSTFNFVLQAKLNSGEAFSTVRQVVEHFKKKRHPFAWYLGPSDRPAQLGNILLNEGFHFVEDNVGMYLEVDAFPKKGESPLQFERVSDVKHWKDFDEVNIKSGESSHFDPLFRHLPVEAFSEGSPLELYVGYRNGKPVTTGIIVFHAGVAGIYFVATDPQERRKGYGSYTMERLFKRAKEKEYSLVTLQATRDGRFLYENLGFKVCGLFKEFTYR